MKEVYLLLDTTNGNVIALYDDVDLAEKLKEPIEKRLNVTLRIEKRTVNLDIALIGVFK